MNSNRGDLDFLERQVLSFVKRFGLLEQGDLVLAAVSGGADSVCLLLVLNALERFLDVHVEAVTVNHGIRGTSAAEDVEFVRKLCQEREIPLHICQVDVPKMVRREQLSEEEAARKARYQCFAQVAEEIGAQAVAVAHHEDDNCETILHHLFRGSGLRGLSGMPPQRRMGNLRIIRPLLEVKRCEIEVWLQEQNISWRLDETNLEDDYTRNRIRHHVIPLLEREINEQASAHVVKAGTYIAEAQALVEGLAVQWLDQHGCFVMETDDMAGIYVAGKAEGAGGKAKNAGGSQKDAEFVVQIPADALLECRPIVRREIFVQVCRKVKGETDFKDMGHVHLEMLERLAFGATSRRVELPGGLLAKKQYGYLLFRKQKKMGQKKNGKEDEIHQSAERNEIFLEDGKIVKVINPELAGGISFKIFSYKGEKIPENSYTKWFDYDKIKNGLSLRTRQPGDYFLLDHGGRKKLKSYMIDRKIPLDQRDKMLLLAEGSHVLWISDGRISAAYKVGRDTHYVLELYMKEEKYHERKSPGSADRGRS